MEQMTRRTVLMNAVLGAAALSAVTAMLLAQSAGAAASPDSGEDRRDDHGRHHRRRHDRHDDHRHDRDD